MHRVIRFVGARSPRWATYVLLIAFCVAILVPFAWMISGGVKSRAEIFKLPLSILPRESNLVQNWNNLLTKRPHFLRNIGNSTFVAATYTLGVLFFCSLIGYGFAKHEFPGRGALFAVVLATMMVPTQATIIPLYLLFRKIGWMNTYYPLIIPGLAQAFGIFFMRQYISTVPNDLLDSARIDGAGEFRIYLRIVLPIIKPALATLGIITFMTSWNSYFWPVVVLTEPKMQTLQVAVTNMSGAIRVPYELIMLGCSISLLVPIVVFLIFQRFFIQGLMVGSIKG
jgi:ABC-type glycerol-3-phosphate transport system permease component